MGITLEEKIDIINNRIDNMNIHIEILERDIASNPNDDVEGKRPRIEVLNDFYLKRSLMLQEREALTNQG
jgi:ribosomal protein S15P/S13E